MLPVKVNILNKAPTCYSTSTLYYLYSFHYNEAMLFFEKAREVADGKSIMLLFLKFVLNFQQTVIILINMGKIV